MTTAFRVRLVYDGHLRAVTEWLRVTKNDRHENPDTRGHANVRKKPVIARSAVVHAAQWPSLSVTDLFFLSRGGPHFYRYNNSAVNTRRARTLATKTNQLMVWRRLIGQKNRSRAMWTRVGRSLERRELQNITKTRSIRSRGIRNVRTPQDYVNT